MLHRRLIKSLISKCYLDVEELKNIEFLFTDIDTFESLNLVSNKPISVFATEDTAIVTIHLTKGLGLRSLTLKDFEYDNVVDLDDMQTVILFDVDGKYMICNGLYSGVDYNVDRLEFSIYLTETKVYVK